MTRRPAAHEAVPTGAASSMTGDAMTLTYPAKLSDVVTSLLNHGWSFVLQHGKDTGDHPFISIEAQKAKDGEKVRITWHTRATGTYRLFSCMVNKRDVSLTKAMAVIEE